MAFRRGRYRAGRGGGRSRFGGRRRFGGGRRRVRRGGTRPLRIGYRM